MDNIFRKLYNFISRESELDQLLHHQKEMTLMVRKVVDHCMATLPN